MKLTIKRRNELAKELGQRQSTMKLLFEEFCGMSDDQSEEAFMAYIKELMTEPEPEPEPLTEKPKVSPMMQRLAKKNKQSVVAREKNKEVNRRISLGYSKTQYNVIKRIEEDMNKASYNLIIQCVSEIIAEEATSNDLENDVKAIREKYTLQWKDYARVKLIPKIVNYQRKVKDKNGPKKAIDSIIEHFDERLDKILANREQKKNKTE